MSLVAEKRQTVIFPLYKEDWECFVLLGKNAEWKKMAGIRNWFGGKCEVYDNWLIESAIDCVIRETKEETLEAIELQENNIKRLWNVIMEDMTIVFFITYLKDKISIKDNAEMIDIRWFNTKHTNEFLYEMLSGDEEVIENLNEFIHNENTYTEFNIDKTGNTKLKEQVKNIYS